jgi:hypothetical protein
MSIFGLEFPNGTGLSHHMSVEEEEEESEWDVEAIVDSRKQRGHLQFLVKWFGFPDSQNSWQDEKDLENCRELVKEFLLTHPPKSPVARQRRPGSASRSSRRPAQKIERPIPVRNRSPPLRLFPVSESLTEPITQLKTEPVDAERPFESDTDSDAAQEINAASEVVAATDLGPGVVPVKVTDGFMRKKGNEFVIYYMILLSDGTTREFSSAEARKLKRSIIVDYLIGMFDLGYGCFYTMAGRPLSRRCLQQ